MRPLATLVAAAMVAGCAKKPEEKDAGVAAPERPAVEQPVKRSIDLRSVLLLVFPEYRGTNLRSAGARLTRTLSGARDYGGLARALFEKNRVVERADDAGVSGTFDLFSLRVAPQAGGAVATIELPISGETLAGLYSNPAALSSAQLGLWLPREGVTIARDVFDFDLDYDAVTENRAAFLSRQLVDLLLANAQWAVDGPLPSGWAEAPPDGGRGAVPGSFTVTLKGVVDGATISVTREGRRVTVRYALVTFEP
ncbi:MAG: hypothetical protein INH41_09160 [Myxococcaceae bacterium]|jgi:hypothetical protein|nr:hypothetical protein [Myxococcaceae bacterium]